MDKAESQDNNMSMEDILSSIKGILSENEKQSPEQTVQTQAPQEKPEDKVYDLSASMIVEEHQPTPKTPTTEIKDADFYIDDLPMPSADKPEDTAELPEFKLDSPHTEIDVDSEPIFDSVTWNSLVERVLVNPKNLIFEFKNGEKIKITI